MKLSVCIATFNEEENIAKCLESINDLVDEIIIVDGSSTDKTVEIARRYKAKVYVTKNHPIFHINKQKSFDLATGDWILYLDADERVTKDLSSEIKGIIKMGNVEINDYQKKLSNKDLFFKHQRLLEVRDGKIGDDKGDYVAFFIPRLNYFLGSFLKYGGVYPDGVIRLFKKNKAFLPCKSVHEQMVVLGKVGWLENNLLHMDSPNLRRYLERNHRYIKLMLREFEEKNLQKNTTNFLQYTLIKPMVWFFWTLIRHKGILDGIPGIIFSLFSALRFPRAYLLYLLEK